MKFFKYVAIFIGFVVASFILLFFVIASIVFFQDQLQPRIQDFRNRNRFSIESQWMVAIDLHYVNSITLFKDGGGHTSQGYLFSYHLNDDRTIITFDDDIFYDEIFTRFISTDNSNSFSYGINFIEINGIRLYSSLSDEYEKRIQELMDEYEKLNGRPFDWGVRD